MVLMMMTMLTGFYNLQDISRSHQCPSITISYHLGIAGGGNVGEDDHNILSSVFCCCVTADAVEED